MKLIHATCVMVKLKIHDNSQRPKEEGATEPTWLGLTLRQKAPRQQASKGEVTTPSTCRERALVLLVLAEPHAVSLLSRSVVCVVSRRHTMQGLLVTRNAAPSLFTHPHKKGVRGISHAAGGRGVALLHLPHPHLALFYSASCVWLVAVVALLLPLYNRPSPLIEK